MMNLQVDDLMKNINNEQILKKNLETLITQGKNIELNNADVFKTLLKHEDAEVIQITAQAIAELAKSERNRKKFTDAILLKTLMKLIENDVTVTTVQVVRALGNICYENEAACKLFCSDNLNTIILLLNNEASTRVDLLISVSCGLLLNLLMLNQDFQKQAIDLNMLQLVENLLKKYQGNIVENNDIFTHLLMVLNIIVDYLPEKNINFPESLCAVLVDILRVSTNPEISILCLEILHGQSENHEIKIFLAKSGTCELIFELVEQYGWHVDDEESRAVLKMACDLIVIILTGDECMDILYNNGKGKVYQNMISWLNSKDVDILSTGILAIGNFARNDLHCIQMVENGIAKTLLEILEKHNSQKDDMKLQHALLSTLRNLAIPPANKEIILKEGLIEIVYPLIKSEQCLVIFRLLGTLRMVVDGQEKTARDLIMRKDLLEKLVDWSFNSDHLGVRGEAPRLLAWLIKYCHSFTPLSHLLSVKDCLKCLVEMISSNHALMQNEAIYGLLLLCKGLDNNFTDRQKFNELLIEANIAKNLAFVINKYYEKMDSPTVENIISLLSELSKSPIVSEHLKVNEVDVALRKLANNNKNVCSLELQLIKIADNIQKNR